MAYDRGSDKAGPSSILIRGGAPNWRMNNSYDNASFGGHLCPFEKPTIDLLNLA
jgi:hypothetical protein